jgi:hypothetical protein
MNHDPSFKPNKKGKQPVALLSSNEMIFYRSLRHQIDWAVLKPAFYFQGNTTFVLKLIVLRSPDCLLPWVPSSFNAVYTH